MFFTALGLSGFRHGPGETGVIFFVVYQGIGGDSRKSRTLIGHIIPGDIEILCVEINLRKQKWILLGIYRLPSLNEKYFFDHLSRVVDYYSRKFERLVIIGDFNCEPSDEHVESFCAS